MTGSGLTRATTLDELRAKVAPLVTDESYAAGLAFVPRSSDVIISPYSKCGTTWLQQMVHSLRTGGDLDFDDISAVVPWIETAVDLGIDIDAEQRAEPRAFKSHLSWNDVPKGARYIVSVRDPRDALVSLYRFFEGWFFEPGTIDIESFGRMRFVESRSYYTHLASWWPRRDEPDVLLVAYEQMLADGEDAVRRVAQFLELDADDERIAVAYTESSFASMRANRPKYEDSMMRAHSERVCGLPPGSDTAKVRVGESGSHRAELSEALRADLDVAWRETIGAQFGIPDYEALLTDLASRPTNKV